MIIEKEGRNVKSRHSAFSSVPHSNWYGKYRVSPPDQRTMDGRCFASKAEMRRYAELKLLLKAGKIKNLVIQPKFELTPPFVLNQTKHNSMYYFGDFQYVDCESGKKIVEDVKGVETAVFKIKEKLLAFRHHIELRKVKTSEISR